MLNQIQIENLSTEEYSEFLAFGDPEHSQDLFVDNVWASREKVTNLVHAQLETSLTGCVVS